MKAKFRFTNGLLKTATVLIMLTGLIGFGVMVVSAQDELTGVEWQWTSLDDGGTTTTVPDPSQYNLTFNDDGTFSVQADCNRIAGTYNQDGGDLQLQMGPSTLAACPEGSLDAVFTSLLAGVVSGGTDGAGNLTLETAGGAQQKSFRSATAAAAGATGAASTGPLGLPLWLWALLALLLLALLWWLFGRRQPVPSPPPEPVAPPISRTVTTETPPVRTVTPEPPPPPSRDDLTRIEGIGPKIEGILNGAGILTYLGLSTATVERLRDILNTSDLRGASADPTTWPEQAKLAVEGKWAELEALQAQLKGGRRM